MKKLKFTTRKHYGQLNIYPLGSEGKAIENLTGKKTVNTSDLKSLSALGFQIEIDSDSETAKEIFFAIRA